MAKSRVLQNNFGQKFFKTHITPISSTTSVCLTKKPKRRKQEPPRSPFIYFYREYRSKHPHMPIVQLAAAVSKLWYNMSSKEKKRYISGKFMKRVTVAPISRTKKRKKSAKRLPSLSRKISEISAKWLSEKDTSSETSLTRSNFIKEEF